MGRFTQKKHDDSLQALVRPGSLDVIGQQTELFPFDAFNFKFSPAEDEYLISLKQPWKFDAEKIDIGDIIAQSLYINEILATEEYTLIDGGNPEDPPENEYDGGTDLDAEAEETYNDNTGKYVDVPLDYISIESPLFFREGVMGPLQSINYEEGSEGWLISPDGDVEFNNGVFRGNLEAARGTFYNTDETEKSVVIENGELQLNDEDALSASRVSKIYSYGTLIGGGMIFELPNESRLAFVSDGFAGMYGLYPFDYLELGNTTYPFAEGSFERLRINTEAGENEPETDSFAIISGWTFNSDNTHSNIFNVFSSKLAVNPVAATIGYYSNDSNVWPINAVDYDGSNTVNFYQFSSTSPVLSISDSSSTFNGTLKIAGVFAF